MGLDSHLTGYVRDLLELEAERDRLREALRPFARELELGGTIGTAVEAMEGRDWQALAEALSRPENERG